MKWMETTWPRLAGAAGGVAILPLGAVEAHGPHLPVGADVWIAEAMARAGAARLAAAGVPAFVLPALAYAPAPCAAGFPGTLSIRAETLAALLADLAGALADQGVAVLALANAHFDPAQVAVLRAGATEIAGRGRLRVAFPDLTRRALAARLTEEFRSGACHAGRYETSILLAERPDLVDESERAGLPEVRVALGGAARGAASTFRALGLDAAYCGAPAAATSAEGRATVARLGELLAEAVQAVWPG